MRNIKLVLEYDGTDYGGWQKQAAGGRRTIQGTVEAALKQILGEDVRVTGSGRTDAGVHAEGQAANFRTRSGLPAAVIGKAINAVLPRDIVVRRVSVVGDDFHARFRARAKIYRYRILNQPQPSVFQRRFVHFVRCRLDAGLMKKEARCLLGRHDFKSFQAADKKERGSIRKMSRIRIKRDGGLITIEIEGDGFLRGMARAIAGTLIDIGRGKLPPGSMKKILLARNRRWAGPAAPAKGLCLVRVKYR